MILTALAVKVGNIKPNMHKQFSRLFPSPTSAIKEGWFQDKGRKENNYYNSHWGDLLALLPNPQ